MSESVSLSDARSVNTLFNVQTGRCSSKGAISSCQLSLVMDSICTSIVPFSLPLMWYGPLAAVWFQFDRVGWTDCITINDLRRFE